MSFLETVESARAFLERNGRVSLRALQREFNLDDDALEELIEELVEIQRIAVRDGRSLAWADPVSLAPGGTPEIERDPRDYTPKHLADKILRSKSALEGERKQVTVLFADVKGSMELAEELDPEVWHGLLDRFFQILAEGVHRFEGSVNQYTGDGIMALFGAPIAHEDHAQRACYAVLDLREKLSRYAKQVKREHGVTFSIRMGLNSGEVIVGRIGDDLRMDYTAQGHAVGLAQRMEQLASPDTCYLTAATAELVAGYFELEDLGEFNVSGVERPVAVHQLLGIGAARSRFDVSRRRGLSRFVGRQADMQTLDAALANAIEGHGQVVGLVAEAGTGKSRLCFEFLERCASRGIPVARGHAVAHGKNVPYLPMLEIFRDYYGIQIGDAPRAVREKIAGRLLLIDESLQDALPLLFDVFGVGDPERPVAEMDPDARQRRIFGALRRLVQGEGEPRVWLVEDLHWMDSASEQFIAQWVDTVPGTRSVLLLNFRPEYSAGWATKSWYQQLPLAPLGREAIQELLDDLLGTDASVSGLAERIQERTKGNPFFAEEIAQSLIESGALEGQRGGYKLVEPVDQLEIPTRVTSLLAARIDRLGERDKHVLQAAAVLGKEFSAPLLEAVSQVSVNDLAEALERLQGGEFLYPQALYPVAEYTFKHPLTQEVALGSMLSARHRALHGNAARALEQTLADRLDENAALLAHHWEEAGEAREALRWHARAADWVVRRAAAPVESVRHWQRVRALGASLRDDPDVAPTLLTACRSVLMLGAWRLGLDREEVDQVANEGRALAERLGARDQLSTLVVAQATARGASGDVAGFHKLAREGAELLDEDALLEDRVVAQTQLVYAAFCAGRLAEGRVAVEELRLLAADDPSLGLAGIGFSALGLCDFLGGWIVWLEGDLPSARRCLADGLPRMQELGYRESAAYYLNTGAILARYYGGSIPGLPDPVGAALEAIEIAEASGNLFLEISARSGLTQAQLACGRFVEAAEGASDGLQMMREWNVSRVIEPDLLAIQAHALLSCGDPADSQRLAREAIELAHRGPMPIAEIDAQLALAASLMAAQKPDVECEVSAALDRVLELIHQTGARTFEPQLYERRAQLAAQLGDVAACESHRRAALTLFREIGAEAHAERLAKDLE